MLRVLSALVLREIATRYGRTPGGYFWAIAEPAAVVTALSLIFSQIAHRPPLGTSFPFYFASGYLAFHFYSDVAQKTGQAIRMNLPLMQFPRVTPIDAILARFSLQALTLLIVFALIITAIVIQERLPLQFAAGRLMLAVALALAMGLAVGAMNCVLFVLAPVWEQVFSIVNRPLFLISGVFFNYESLPRNLQEILWFNPLIHLTALMRQGFFPTYRADFISVPFVICAVAGIATLAALVLRGFGPRIAEP